MGLILIGVFIAVIGGILYSAFDIEGGEFISWVGIAIFGIMVIAIPITRFSCISEIVKFESVQTSILEARQNDNISEFELAALQQKVIEKNEWLAEQQFWANHWLCDLHYPTKRLNRLVSIR
ncbi:hypothetical protein KKH23_07835 [Patescibacteria group bacterium]|uniref:Uncharacterized protein n=1 Tax=viral metagenome TaxID=1070528 RepID=A0A6M3X7Z2_9ZZZZ|nr:hypothetical protein [Patescibacteria group bacterium]